MSQVIVHAGAVKKHILVGIVSYLLTLVGRPAPSLDRRVLTHALFSATLVPAHLAPFSARQSRATVENTLRERTAETPITTMDGAAESYAVTCCLVRNTSALRYVIQAFVVLAK